MRTWRLWSHNCRQSILATCHRVPQLCLILSIPSATLSRRCSRGISHYDAKKDRPRGRRVTRRLEQSTPMPMPMPPPKAPMPMPTKAKVFAGIWFPNRKADCLRWRRATRRLQEQSAQARVFANFCSMSSSKLACDNFVWNIALLLLVYVTLLFPLHRIAIYVLCPACPPREVTVTNWWPMQKAPPEGTNTYTPPKKAHATPAHDQNLQDNCNPTRLCGSEVCAPLIKRWTRTSASLAKQMQQTHDVFLSFQACALFQLWAATKVQTVQNRRAVAHTPV